MAPDDQLAQGRRDPGCCRRALQRKDRADESRSTSTMIVDDDGDGGGKKWVCRERGRGGWVSGLYPFLGSDKSTTDQVGYDAFYSSTCL
ncbi:hypothetical protein Syun_000569 [Stephania yunnanensis]|uniref:Uncharacterized protein n=1 Tax=Stephania yunnanensis TaxID=152371 RepID=A0AAP0Q6W7_9MAGN